MWKRRKKKTEIELYSAGAIVRHKSIFHNLPTYQNKEEITQQFREEWILPFYFNLNNTDDYWVQRMIELKHQITDDVILKNLGDFDWRTRSTGAYFAAITNSSQFTDIIGAHLLKSEVCYAGVEYAKTLVSFESIEAAKYLLKYLEYYLNKYDLFFDQTEVFTALKCYDEQHGTNLSDFVEGDWKRFIDVRRKTAENDFKKMKLKRNITQTQLDAFNDHIEYWKYEIDTSHFRDQINVINKIKNTDNSA